MRILFGLITAIALLSGLNSKAATSAEISEAERQALAEWSARKNRSNDVLLTPLIGAKRPAARAKRQLEEMIRELGGERIQGKNIVVNIYGSGSLNAYASEESESIPKNETEQMWPVRRLMGFDGNGQPVYEIGVYLGLLRKLQTKDELAFVLAHELTHIIEGHVHHTKTRGEQAAKWYSSQANEAVADRGALELMLGKYELDGAMRAYEKLHPRQERLTTQRRRMQVSHAISAGASSHHSEGVRTSMLQFSIESLRRTETSAQPRPMSPHNIGTDLRVDERPRAPDLKAVPIMNEYMGYLENYILKGKHYPHLYDRTKWPSGGSFYDPQPTAEQLRAFWMEALDKIEASSLSKAQKVNAFLEFNMLVYKLRMTNWRRFSVLSSQERNRVLMFLANNSSGPDGWKHRDYLNLAEEFRHHGGRLLETLFFEEDAGRDILMRLKRSIGAWQEFFSYTYRRERFLDSGKFSVALLNKTIEALVYTDRPMHPLIREAKYGFYETLSRLTPQELFSELSPNGNLRITSAWQTLAAVTRVRTSINREAFVTSRLILQALKRHEPAYNEAAIANAERLARDPRAEAKPQLLDFMSYRKLDSFTAPQMQRLQNLVFKQAKSFTQAPRNAILDIGHVSDEAIKVASTLVASDKFTSAQKKTVIKYLSASDDPGSRPLRHGDPVSEQNFRRFFDSLSKPEILELIFSGVPWLDHLESRIKAIAPPLPKRPGDRSFRYYHQRLRAAVKRAGMSSTFGYSGDLERSEHAWAARFNVLNFVAMGSDDPPRALRDITFQEVAQVMNRLKEASSFHDINQGLWPTRNYSVRTENLTIGATRMLINALARSRSQAPDFASWLSLYEQVRDYGAEEFAFRVDEKARLAAVIKQAFSRSSADQRFEWLKRKSVTDLLSTTEIADEIVKIIDDRMRSNRSTNITEVISRIDRELELRNKFPESYSLVRDHTARTQNLQPSNIDQVFPTDDRTLTEKAMGARGHIRGLGAVTEMTRVQSPEAQLEMIDFLMGRSDRLPHFVNEAEVDVAEIGRPIDVRGILFAVRNDLERRGAMERAFAVNSFLAGNNGFISEPAGLEMLLNRILSAVSESSRPIARIMAESLMRAEGPNKSLFLSYVLAQQEVRTENGREVRDARLKESLVLKSLLDAYGVPTVKLAQYLAFSEEFSQFRTALASYQDAAMPLTYYEMLKLIQDRMGSNFDPSQHRVLGMVGSGSINIGIEYLDLQTNERRVLNLSRQDIETKTAEDFRRFRMLMDEVSRHPEQQKFEFVVGLMNVVERSVTLEFDRAHAFNMQRGVESLYNRTVDGWHVRTVSAYDLVGMGIFMEKAPGIGATRILNTDPATYNSAMGALWKVEDEVLRGMDESGRFRPVPLHANPDLHDGQVLIDKANKTVTFIDFGQAAELSNAERVLAIDILRIVSGAESAEGAVRMLETAARQSGKTVHFDLSEIREILSRTDRMDKFVRLISYSQRAGFDLPLSSVHWVLAANRLIKLGDKIGIRGERTFRALVISRKLGIPLGVHNAITSGARYVSDRYNALLGRPSRPILPGSCQAVFH